MKQTLFSLYHDFLSHVIACTSHVGHVINPVCYLKKSLNCV